MRESRGKQAFRNDDSENDDDKNYVLLNGLEEGESSKTISSSSLSSFVDSSTKTTSSSDSTNDDVDKKEISTFEFDYEPIYKEHSHSKKNVEKNNNNNDDEHENSEKPNHQSIDDVEETTITGDEEYEKDVKQMQEIIPKIVDMKSAMLKFMSTQQDSEPTAQIEKSSNLKHQAFDFRQKKLQQQQRHKSPIVDELSGTWQNELGSVMQLEVSKTGILLGDYMSTVGNVNGTYSLVGLFDSDATIQTTTVSFIVAWNNKYLNAHSITSWNGFLQNGTLEMFW